MNILLTMGLGVLFGHGAVMLIILSKGRREDIRRYGKDLLPGALLAYWIITPLSLVGVVACSVSA